LTIVTRSPRASPAFANLRDASASSLRASSYFPSATAGFARDVNAIPMTPSSPMREPMSRARSAAARAAA